MSASNLPPCPVELQTRPGTPTRAPSLHASTARVGVSVNVPFFGWRAVQWCWVDRYRRRFYWVECADKQIPVGRIGWTPDNPSADRWVIGAYAVTHAVADYRADRVRKVSHRLPNLSAKIACEHWLRSRRFSKRSDDPECARTWFNLCRREGLIK